MATIFSKIAAGEIPSYKVAENERFCAFLDINPLAVGHTLVIPRFDVGAREADYIFDLDDDTLGRMMMFAKGVAARIRAVTGCARVAVVVIGLEVPHVHIHLIPINSEADVDFRAPRVKLSPEQFAELAAKLSASV